MNEDADPLVQAARQLIETEMLFGSDFLPARRNPLPEPQAAHAEPQPSGPQAGAGQMTAQQKADALNDIDAHEVRTCARCRLCERRTHTVFGEGNPDADLVFVGEGPGEEEDRQGRPFVGRAGELLTRMIAAMGLTRQDVYICNLIKCRPPGNRAPAPEEIKACWDYLLRQLRILEPGVIVTLGNPATQNLLNTRVGITKMRGQWQRLPMIGEGLAGIDVMPTFHPAFVLRKYTPDNRGKVWSDLQAVMERLGLDGPDRP